MIFFSSLFAFGNNLGLNPCFCFSCLELLREGQFCLLVAF